MISQLTENNEYHLSLFNSYHFILCVVVISPIGVRLETIAGLEQKPGHTDMQVRNESMYEDRSSNLSTQDRNSQQDLKEYCRHRALVSEGCNSLIRCTNPKFGSIDARPKPTIRCQTVLQTTRSRYVKGCTLHSMVSCSAGV
jgi:hypothetical protein